MSSSDNHNSNLFLNLWYYILLNEGEDKNKIYEKYSIMAFTKKF